MSSSPKHTSREFDVILFGATGYTGKLIATYLNSHTQKPRWAMAGRSKARLENVRQQLNIDNSVQVVEATTSDLNSLKKMASKTCCIINVVGPFRLLGAEELVKACIIEGTNYVDLSGETGFNETLIKSYHEQAKKAGVIITPSVGLDSLPSDITTYLAVQYLKQNLKAPGAEEVIVAIKETSSFSTGTIHSACDLADEDARQLQFVDEGRLATRKPTTPLRKTAAIWLPQFKAYGSAYALSPHNVRTIYRTWSLLEDANEKNAYGSEFKCEDTIVWGSWLSSQIHSNVENVSQFMLINVSPLRWLLRKVLPQGGGPSIGKQDSIKTDVRALAQCGEKQAVATLKAPGDPGYKMTARMISEVALAIAFDFERLHPLAKEGGVLTASTTGADIISERLQRFADFEFKIEALQ